MKKEEIKIKVWRCYDCLYETNNQKTAELLSEHHTNRFGSPCNGKLRERKRSINEKSWWGEIIYVK